MILRSLVHMRRIKMISQKLKTKRKLNTLFWCLLLIAGYAPGQSYRSYTKNGIILKYAGDYIFIDLHVGAIQNKLKLDSLLESDIMRTGFILDTSSTSLYALFKKSYHYDFCIYASNPGNCFHEDIEVLPVRLKYKRYQDKNKGLDDYSKKQNTPLRFILNRRPHLYQLNSGFYNQIIDVYSY